jgi:hypothetical protein
MAACACNMQVLDGNTSDQAISRASLDCLRTTTFTERVKQSDGETQDWTMMSLRNTLTLLCQESDYFRQSLLEASQKGGRAPV